ncbi:dynein-associated protein, putative [Hepatocystis sp. ex Piliocolobus tephrosceles]|nr:dynein-associated protein, putative [Hepatocystis sp. ex Piliocolobus tephrosceles]
MKDCLIEYNKYLKYDNPIIIENEEKKKKNSKNERVLTETNIVRVIQEIRKNFRSNIMYKTDKKNIIFNDPIFYIFPIKYIKEKKLEHVFYVARTTSEDEVLLRLKQINETIANLYSKNLIIKEEFLEELLHIFMELCRQVCVLNFPKGVVLKQLFNYTIMLLRHYHKLVKSSLAFNLKKQTKQSEILNNYRSEIENKKNKINSLKIQIMQTEEMIKNEKINAEISLSETNIQYQNKIEKLKKNNQRKEDAFTRLKILIKKKGLNRQEKKKDGHITEQISE